MKNNQYTKTIANFRAPEHAIARILEASEKEEEQKPARSRFQKPAAAAFLAVLLIGVVLFAGSRFCWFASVAADEAEELVIDFGWSTVRLNRNLPDGYEVHLQSEYFPPEDGYYNWLVEHIMHPNYRNPENIPIPDFQVVNQEGQRVLEFWNASKNDTNRRLNEFQMRIEMANGGDTGISFITKDGRDHNGNRFVLIKEDFQIDPEENPDGFIAGIDHRYTLLVDLAESKYSGIIIVGYGSEEEISRLYELVNVRVEEDYDLGLDDPEVLPNWKAEIKRLIENGEFELTW